MFGAVVGQNKRKFKRKEKTMLKTTLKEIKNYDALDITASRENYGRLEVVAKSFGVYGMNGALLKDEKGNFYKITARSSNLFKYC